MPNPVTMTPAQLLALIVLVDAKAQRAAGPVGTDNEATYHDVIARISALLGTSSISTASLLATAERMRAEELERANG